MWADNTVEEKQNKYNDLPTNGDLGILLHFNWFAVTGVNI